MELQEICEKLGVNYDETLGRFAGNEEIYKKFLKKFLQDNTYFELEEAWNEQDYEKIEKKAHTLKGVAGNLGLTKLFQASNELVQTIRKKEYEKISKLYEAVQEKYSTAKNMIENI